MRCAGPKVRQSILGCGINSVGVYAFCRQIFLRSRRLQLIVIFRASLARFARFTEHGFKIPGLPLLNCCLSVSRREHWIAAPDCCRLSWIHMSRISAGEILPSEISEFSRKFTSHDGCRLQIHRWGQDGRACIFLHGFGEGSYIWDDFAPTMAPQYQSIVVDLRGHGDSDWDVLHPHDFDSYVKDVICLIDELRLTQVAIIGHSLGGTVATHVAASRPNEVFALVVVESGPGLRQQGVARMRADFKEAQRSYATIEDYVDWLQQRRTLVPREKIRQFARRSLRLRPDGAFELKCDPRIIDQPARANADTALWNAIAQVRCPALVVRGMASSVLNKDLATKVTKAFARGRLHTIERAGHGLITENPEAFAGAVREFLYGSAIA